MRRQSGLSLVELMISITLGLILMTGVVQMFVSSKVVFNTQQGISRIQETGRLALDFIARDVRMASNYGCFHPDASKGLTLTNSGLNLGGLHTSFDVGIIGYDDATLIPGGVATNLGAVTPVADDPSTPAMDANVLVVRSANKPGFVMSADNNATNVFAYTQSALVNNCVDDACVGSAMVASTCFKARVLQVSGLGVSGNLLTVTHPDSWGATVDYIANNDLLPMNTTVYFLATGVANNGSSLWQRINNGTPQELLEGVEKMRFTYATNQPKTNPNNSIYRTAAAIAASNDWGNVGSVRIELIVRSVEDNIVAEAQPYTFAGTVVPVPATDRHMRQVFSTTVNIRSRGL